jgi:hypothetical protein
MGAEPEAPGDRERQAIAKFLGIEPGQVTDEMIRRAEQGFNTQDPNVQQIPRRKKGKDVR